MVKAATYSWNRYWVRQGENPTMEDGLFVEPSSAIRFFGPTSNGVSLRDLKDISWPPLPVPLLPGGGEGMIFRGGVTQDGARSSLILG